ncbi:hypothetical protein HOH45_01205 [bacterium]|nr:hypothetical protein [bacterium]
MKQSLRNSSVLIVGYYGFANAGDDYLLLQTLRRHISLLSSGRVNILYRCKKISKGTILLDGMSYSVTYVPRKSYISIFCALLRVTEISFGGGSLFQDKTSILSFLYYSMIVCVGKMMRRQINFYGQGFGPMTSRLSKAIFPLILKQVDTLEVRDRESLGYCEVVKNRVVPRLTMDMSFQRVDKFNDSYDEDGVIALSLKEETFTASVLEALRASSTDPWIFIEAHRQVDFKKEWKKQLSISNDRLLDFTYILNNELSSPVPLSMIVSMRFHVCAWAVMTGVPFLAISDDPKLLQLAKQFGQPFINPQEDTVSGVKIRHNLRPKKYRTHLIENRETYLCR